MTRNIVVGFFLLIIMIACSGQDALVNSTENAKLEGRPQRFENNTDTLIIFDDVEYPTVIYHYPGNWQTISVTTTAVVIIFSEPLNPTTVSNETVVVYCEGLFIPVEVIYNDQVVTITFSELLPHGKLFAVSVLNITDLVGNYCPWPFSFYFKTE